MIIQNGQPRNYAICNGRNVAMLRGGQWIVWPYLLSPAVRSQIYADILDASLANEVWRAANLYCKAHQQAHPELTAQGKLLSTFVNNDPDMYASLPLTATPAAQSAMPTRWLKGDGVAYINTNTLPSSSFLKIETIIQAYTAGEFGIYGSAQSADNSDFSLYCGTRTNNQLQFRSGNWSNSININTPYRTTCKIIHYNENGTKQYISLNDGSFTQGNVSRYNANYSLYLFAINYGDSASWFNDCKMQYFKIFNNSSDNLVKHFIPCLNTATNKYGMLDIVNLQWYGNANSTGSFTIEKS